MAKTIVLSQNHFDPYLIEVMQGSVGDTFTFIFKDHAGPHANPSIHLKSPSGLWAEIACTEPANFIGAEFNPDADTFLEPGKYIASLEFGDADDPDAVIYSFPIYFKCLRNPSIREWTFTHAAKGLNSGNSYDVTTGGLAALDDKLFVKVGNGAYTIADGTELKIPDSSTGPIGISYDSTDTGSEITVINRGNDLILIPVITFTAYEEEGTSDMPFTDEIVELVSYQMESEKVNGVASMVQYDEFFTAALPRDPDSENIAIMGYDWNSVTESWDETVVYSTVKSDGTPTTLGAGSNLTATYRPSTRIVAIEATGNANKLNHEKISIVSSYYEPA